jgi:hypothetical protein
MKLMKRIQQYFMSVVLLGAMVALMAGCEEEKEFSADFDIPWVVSTITSVTPLQAPIGAQLTITGENLGADFVPAINFFIGTLSCEVVSQNSTTVVIIVPGGISEPSDVSVRNLHNRTFVYGEQFRPTE